jgi:hypothetical protein
MNSCSSGDDPIGAGSTGEVENLREGRRFVKGWSGLVMTMFGVKHLSLYLCCCPENTRNQMAICIGCISQVVRENHPRFFIPKEFTE